MMPDGTFPNVNIVQDMLQCIDSLSVETIQLEESNLGKIIQYYAEGFANIPSVRPLAKQIMDKWSRIIYKINRQYDPEGQYDSEYRSLQRKLQAVKRQKPDSDDDEEEKAGDGEERSKKKKGKDE